jgi:hypothetical protein
MSTYVLDQLPVDLADPLAAAKDATKTLWYREAAYAEYETRTWLTAVKENRVSLKNLPNEFRVEVARRVIGRNPSSCSERRRP